MNDRTSNRPPSVYTREDDSMEHYRPHAQANRPGNCDVLMDGADNCVDAGIETNKPSGMYRFGRAIVNAFKPVAAWRGFNAARDDKERQTCSEKSIMQERREKAEKAYAELKKNDFKCLRTSFNGGASLETPAIKYETIADEVQPTSHRDSGIGMDGRHPSIATSQDVEGSAIKAQIIPPPKFPALGRSRSPLFEASAIRKTSMQFRKPSLQNLKKAKSHVQLPSAKRNTPLTALDSPTNPHELTGIDMIDRNLRKQPSKKNIAKQQRLSKKVSDLESQLEIARRNLKLSMSDPQAFSETVSHKRPKPFRPGALPSLLSESVLMAKCSGENDENESIKSPLTTFSERQVKIKSEDDNVEAAITSTVTQPFEESKHLFTETKKRKSDIGDEDRQHNPLYETNSGSGQSIAEVTRPKRKSKPSSKVIENEKYAMEVDPNVGGNKQQSSAPGKSDQIEVEPVPPLPATPNLFDPAKVDQTKMLSMRSPCNRKIPFGRDSEDVINLRKEFPAVADSQLVEYLAGLNGDDKKTDYTSLSHHNRPATPLLPPPRCTSPIKAEPLKRSKDQNLNTQSSRSPQNLSSASMNSVNFTNSKGVQGRNLLKGPQLFPNLAAARNPKTENEKPLPAIQMEDYEWPEDVF